MKRRRRRANRLSKLEFDEISLVTRGANQGARVVLFKSADSSANPSATHLRSQSLADYQREHTEAQNNRLMQRTQARANIMSAIEGRTRDLMQNDATLTYDNSATNPRNPTSPPVRVKWGPMSTDEMGSVTLHVIAAREEETATLRDAVKDHAADMVIDRALARAKRPQIVQTMLDRFDKNANGQMEPEERPELRNFIKNSGWFPGGLNNTF